MDKTAAAGHLSIKNRKTEVVSSLKIAYPSEDVLALNVDGEGGVSKPFCEGLQSHKSKHIPRS